MPRAWPPCWVGAEGRCPSGRDAWQSMEESPGGGLGNIWEELQAEGTSNAKAPRQECA